METRRPTSEPDTVTLYHRDGDALMLTHYCSVGNQPRMRAEAPHSLADALTFSFVDVSNLATPWEGHMHQLTVTFQDDDHIKQAWIWREAGIDTLARFLLTRKDSERSD